MDKYLWDTKENIRHSIRVICDEEKLPFELKNILTACVQQESGFNLNAIGINRNKAGTITSRDWGLVQINDYYHIGPGKDFSTSEYVLSHPEACVRWMVKLFKAGKMHLWASYTSGAYKKYL